MSFLESARILGYGIMVPVLVFTGFLIYRRNPVSAAFFLLQGAIYLISLSFLVFQSKKTISGSPLEPVYSMLIVIEAVVSVLIIYREWSIRKKLRGILYESDIPTQQYQMQIQQEEKKMPKFQIPGVLPVALILLLPPAIIPVIEQFFPTNTYWWSALLVVIFNVIVLVVRISWPEESSKVPMPMSQEALQGSVSPVQERSTINKLLLGA